MSGPDVRWEGVPHEQILAWVNEGPGPSLTEQMEAKLKSAAEALAETSDLVNTTLQQVNSGGWTGTAANAAAGAMQVLRDFDDTMRHRSTVSDITAFGQSDSAGWARTSVPPAVEVGPAPAPMGSPEDVLRNTEDYQDQQLARKDAEQRARQVMREYTAMTTDRVRSMPQLAPAPQVVLDVGEPDLAVAGGDGPRGSGEPGPGGGAGTEPGGSGGGPGAGGGEGGRRVAGDQSGPVPSGAESQVPPATTAPALAPRAVDPRSAAGIAQVGGAPETAGATGLPAGGVLPLGAVAGPLGSAGPGGAGNQGGAGNRGGESGGRPGAGNQGGAAIRSGEPGGRPGAGRGEPGTRAGEPGVRASEPGARTAQQSPHVRGGTGPAGVAPVGAPVPRDDRERQLRYAVPSSAIFEPDEDDGQLRDPYHAGAHVPPPAIGAED